VSWRVNRTVRFLDHVIGIRAREGRRAVSFFMGEVAEISEKQIRVIARMEKRSGIAAITDFRGGTETWWCRDCLRRFVASVRGAHQETFHKKVVEYHVCFEKGCKFKSRTMDGLSVHMGHAGHGRFGDSARYATGPP